MSGRSIVAGICAVVLAALISVPAKATTVDIDPGGTAALGIGNLYADAYLNINPNVALSNQYNFTLAAAPLGTISTAISLGAIDLFVGIKDLTVTWYKDLAVDVLLGSLAFTDSFGNVIDPAAKLYLTLLTSGNYYVLITGTGLSGGLSYLLNIVTYESQTEVPLPPALILFLTGLFGLTLLGRRRRSTGPGLAV